MFNIKGVIAPIIVFLFTALVVHLITLVALPKVYMHTAMGRLTNLEIGLHEFSVPRRVTSLSRDIVRPSPDLSYSVCLFDLSEGPVGILATPWDGYGSLSIFDANTDNVFVTSLDTAQDAPRGVTLRWAEQDSVAPEGFVGLPVVTLDAPRGVAILRRLAPDDASFAKAAAFYDSDICAPVKAS